MTHQTRHVKVDAACRVVSCRVVSCRRDAPSPSPPHPLTSPFLHPALNVAPAEAGGESPTDTTIRVTRAVLQCGPPPKQGESFVGRFTRERALRASMWPPAEAGGEHSLSLIHISEPTRPY